MCNLKIIVLFPVLLICMNSCSTEEVKEEKKETSAPVVEQKITDSTSFANNVWGFSGVPEAVGVYDVPEMLVLSIIDSAASKDISSKMVKNYAVLEEELKATGAEMNGPLGTITYNNDAANFKFETILCIRRIPAVQPKRCKIVVLEAFQMLVYNFYGSYQNLFGAYDKIKRYCEKNDLLQSGPMREFYLTDPETEKDQKKWLTRILLPVISMHKK